jgi:hypothetical protein
VKAILAVFIFTSCTLVSVVALPPTTIRFATFNCSLNRSDIGGPLSSLLSVATSTKPKQVAEIIQRVRPHVLLLNEFDFDAAQPDNNPQLFQTNYLSVPQNGNAGITFAHRYVAPVNTGLPSGFDLNRSGSIGTTLGTDAYGDDCLGFGQWPGQYGMVIYSRYPIQTSAIRTFQQFLWKDMPGAVLPDDAATPAVANDWYSPAMLNVFRLSSKSHWHVPISFDGHIVHLLAHHPTPPVFDGGEDRNGKRNHDEIRLWADYISPGKASYIKDDNGVSGGLPEHERFVILGDHNADPFRGDSYLGAIKQLLDHPKVNSLYSPSRPNYTPAHAFGSGYWDDDAYLTGNFATQLRVDYVLPSQCGLRVLAGAVYWPQPPDLAAPLVGVSDHRLVYHDLGLNPVAEQAVQNLVTLRTPAGIRLQWQGRAGYGYTVQQATNLSGPWATAPTIPVTVAAGNYAAFADDTVVSPGRKFYRIEVRFQ